MQLRFTSHLLNGQRQIPLSKKKLQQAETEVDRHLKDNINTKDTIVALLNLVNAANIYLRDNSNPKKTVLIQKISGFVKQILNIFGLFQNVEASDNNNNNNKLLNDVLTQWTGFRNEIRTAARTKQPYTEFFKATDKIRENLIDLGISLTDDEETKTGQAFKLEDPSVIKQRRALEEMQKKEKEIKKLENSLLTADKQLKKFQETKIAPKDLFQDKTLYGEWDSEGVPTKKADKTELPKGTIKNLKKKFDTQKKFYEEYQKSLQSDPEKEKNLEEKVQQLKESIAKLQGPIGSNNNNSK